MATVEETLNNFKKAYGEPPEGFEEFRQSLQFVDPLLPETSVPSICKGYLLPSGIQIHDIMLQPYFESRTMSARPSDVIVASYPKCGTTWTQEICYLILHGVDLQKANSKTLEERIPFIEIPPIGIKGIEKMPDPRLIKTHLPYDDLPLNFRKNKTKVVYIARNPKDTVVSFYHFLKMVGFFGYTGTIDRFLDLLIDNKLIYGDMVEHFLGYWKRRNDGNVLFLTYEGLQKDFKGELRKIAKFLGKPLTEEQVDQVTDHCSFASMSKNPMTNYSQGGATVKGEGSQTSFMRKGKVGDWRNHFSPDMSRKMDDYIEKALQGSDLKFDYELH